MYRFRCEEESRTRLVGSRTLVCDGRQYNDSLPRCVEGPTSLAISGPDTVTVGEEETFTCTTDPAVKPGRLEWSVTDRTGQELDQVILSTENLLLPADQGLSLSQSSLTVSLSVPVSSLVLACVSESEGHTVTRDKRLDVHCK